jgi:hypothetical protein
MKAGRLRIAAGSLILSSLALALPVQASATAAPIPCEALGISPSFGHDHSALCIARHQLLPSDQPIGEDVSFTTDGGRGWHRQTATGLPATGATRWSQVVFSADYSNDHKIYVQEASSGLFVTSDGGATFTVADPVALGGGNYPQLTAFFAGGPVAAGIGLPTVPALAYTGAGGTAILVPPVHLPTPSIVSTNSAVQTFLTLGPQMYAVIQSGGSSIQTTLTRCTTLLVCSDTAASLPPGEFLQQAGAATISGHRDIWLTTGHLYPHDEAIRIWRYDPTDQHLTEWTDLERAVSPGRPIAFGITISIANLHGAVAALVDGPGFARRLLGATTPSTWRLWASRTIASGSLPSNGVATSPYFGNALLSGGDRLFTIGNATTSTFAGDALYCTLDGRHWHTHC